MFWANCSELFPLESNCCSSWNATFFFLFLFLNLTLLCLSNNIEQQHFQRLFAQLSPFDYFTTFFPQRQQFQRTLFLTRTHKHTRRVKKSTPSLFSLFFSHNNTNNNNYWLFLTKFIFKVATNCVCECNWNKQLTLAAHAPTKTRVLVVSEPKAWIVV